MLFYLTASARLFQSLTGRTPLWRDANTEDDVLDMAVEDEGNIVYFLRNAPTE